MATTAVHPVVNQVTERIRRRSKPTRDAYLKHLERARYSKPARAGLSCTNFAHGFAALYGGEGGRPVWKPGVDVVLVRQAVLA